MNFLNKIVFHRVFGEGTVCTHEQSRFEVQFGDAVKTFSFPMAFNGFLKFANEEDQQAVEQLLQEKEASEAKERLSWLNNNVTSTPHTGVREKKPPRKVERPNIVFKCNFCDGGSNKNHIGYTGACSDAVIRYNIEVARHSWCSDSECPCNQYYHGEINRRALDQICHNDGFTCYESKMLNEWTAAAGTYLTEDRKMEPKKIRNVQLNSLAVLTTRLPNFSEEDRFVFGVFLVDDANEGDHKNEGSVRSNSNYRIELTPEEAKQIKFWNYHTNDTKPEKAEAEGGEEFPEIYTKVVEQLSRLLSEDIKIKRSADGSGKIVVGFASDEEIAALAEKLEKIIK